ncbi:MAG: dTDP-4-dehydrorhamnose 3,5-epimerase [Chitinophagaceae bacterium]
MIFSETILKGCYIVQMEPKTDDRGWFARSFCKHEFEAIGHNKEWVQMNHSFTKDEGTVRGMHFQLPPFSEKKLVRCIAGTVCDVIIDLRNGSPTFLKWLAIDLSAENKKMIYVPEGFAHGFQCLTSNCELLYHHSEFYSAAAEGGIRYNDIMLDINWPLPVKNISPRDQVHPLLTAEFQGLKIN